MSVLLHFTLLKILNEQGIFFKPENVLAGCLRYYCSCSEVSMTPDRVTRPRFPPQTVAEYLRVTGSAHSLFRPSTQPRRASRIQRAHGMLPQSPACSRADSRSQRTHQASNPHLLRQTAVAGKLPVPAAAAPQDPSAPLQSNARPASLMSPL